jgi:hypothetical protein
MKGKLYTIAAMTALGVTMMTQTASAQVIVRSAPVVVQNTTVVSNGGFHHPHVVRHYHPPLAVVQPFPAYGVPHRAGFGPGWGPGFGYGGGGFGPAYGWGPGAGFGGGFGPGFGGGFGPGIGWGGGTSVGFGVVRPGLSFGVVRTFR